MIRSSLDSSKPQSHRTFAKGACQRLCRLFGFGLHARDNFLEPLNCSFAFGGRRSAAIPASRPVPARDNLSLGRFSTTSCISTASLASYFAAMLSAALSRSSGFSVLVAEDLGKWFAKAFSPASVES